MNLDYSKLADGFIYKRINDYSVVEYVGFPKLDLRDVYLLENLVVNTKPSVDSEKGRTNRVIRCSCILWIISAWQTFLTDLWMYHFNRTLEFKNYIK